jgi:hypothetical protein
MNPDDLQAVQERLRRAYELDRLRRALLGFAPILVLVAAAAIVGGRYRIAMPAGALLFAGGVLALWYGREPGRGVLPGAIGGSLALVLALCANQMGHFCTGERCMSWCLPACVAGGVIAGGIVSFVGFRQKRGMGYWASASGITLLTGALGCSCVGYAGIGGLAVGFVGAMLVSAMSSLGRGQASH